MRLQSVLILLVMCYMATHRERHSETHVYTLTHLDHSPHQHCCARGRPHTVEIPHHQRGRETGGGGPEEEGQIKGDVNVLGVCE